METNKIIKHLDDIITQLKEAQQNTVVYASSEVVKYKVGRTLMEKGTADEVKLLESVIEHFKEAEKKIGEQLDSENIETTKQMSVLLKIKHILQHPEEAITQADFISIVVILLALDKQEDEEKKN